MKEKRWYTLDDVENLGAQEKLQLTRRYVNPGMAKLFGMLGFDRLWAARAEGMYLELEGGRRVLDMTGGNGVLGLGHNHPAVIAAREKIGRERRLEFCKSFVSPYVAALAANIASLLPGDLQYSFFCNSGAEAVEGALKMAQKHHGPKRRTVVYTDHAFHGKSFAAMSVSSLDDSRKHFHLLDNCHQIPFGDAGALEALFRSRIPAGESAPDICAFILEAIHGTRILFPPAGYLKRVREICDRYGVLMIMDEIYLGFGHTGYWFSFEPEGVTPDIVCYSKSFGGGKASIAGYTARANVFLKAYGKPDESMMHSSTFSGMTEECATALETLDVMRREKLVEKAREMGPYLEEKLAALKNRHPDRILDVRGRGLLWGVELKPLPLDELPLIGKVMPQNLLATLAGVLVLTELFHKHDILAYLGFTRRNLVVISPSLIVTREQLDTLINALDAVCSKNWISMGQAFAARQFWR